MKIKKILKKNISKKYLRKLKNIKDPRGDLSVGNFIDNVPFRPKRYFIFKSSNKSRGEHAHIKCHQFVICVNGKFKIEIDNIKSKKNILLDSPKFGCYLPPGVWSKLHSFSKGTIVLVLASHLYDEKDYIRDYNEYIKYKKSH